MKNWSSPLQTEAGSEVVCIACGDTVRRVEAREYDKHGDRWDRNGKRFEFLCKPCDKSCCHKPRDDLEAKLSAAEATTTNRDAFLREFVMLLEQDEGAKSES